MSHKFFFLNLLKNYFLCHPERSPAPYGVQGEVEGSRFLEILRYKRDSSVVPILSGLLQNDSLLAFIFTQTVLILTVFFTLFFYQQSSAQCTGNKEPVVIKSVDGKFDDIWEDLKRAIEERGLVISDISYIGEMLERTGKDIGRTNKVFGKAWSVEFCSAVLSRDMFEKNPHFIAFCPYHINVYTLHEDEKKVYLSYRRLIWKDDNDKDVLYPVEKLLEDIIDDVIKSQKEYR